MEDLLKEIREASKKGYYYLALFGSLTLPDICGAISSSDGLAKSWKYRDWFDKYVSYKYKVNGEIWLTGHDCYYFRCSLLHQGSTQKIDSRYKRIIIFEPNNRQILVHNSRFKDAYAIDVSIFCEDMIQGAITWLEEKENTELFKNNYNKFMRRHPNGIEGYITGVPVIS